jgi:hypothetical protein
MALDTRRPSALLAGRILKAMIIKGERFVTVLEIPPVNSPKMAVKMAIYSDIKSQRK